MITTLHSCVICNEYKNVENLCSVQGLPEWNFGKDFLVMKKQFNVSSSTVDLYSLKLLKCRRPPQLYQIRPIRLIAICTDMTIRDEGKSMAPPLNHKPPVRFVHEVLF